LFVENNCDADRFPKDDGRFPTTIPPAAIDDDADDEEEGDVSLE
jgi:hypothetical protein